MSVILASVRALAAAEQVSGIFPFALDFSNKRDPVVADGKVPDADLERERRQAPPRIAISRALSVDRLARYEAMPDTFRHRLGVRAAQKKPRALSL
ncbi:MAG: hypothetical protein ACJ8GJ_11145 [Vitreoscilla sp.]